MGRPKALLPYQSGVFITRLIRALGSVATDVIVVTGTHDADIRAAIDIENAASRERVCGAGLQPAAGASAPVLMNAAILPSGRIATVVTNPDPSRGQLSSLQVGLRAVEPGHDAVFFHPVDTPLVTSETIAILRDALAAAPPSTLLAIPRFHGKRGHPVLMRRGLIARFLSLDSSATARDVIQAHRGDTLYVDVEDAGVAVDIDTPEDYRRLVAGDER